MPFSGPVDPTGTANTSRFTGSNSGTLPRFLTSTGRNSSNGSPASTVGGRNRSGNVAERSTSGATTWNTASDSTMLFCSSGSS